MSYAVGYKDGRRGFQSRADMLDAVLRTVNGEQPEYTRGQRDGVTVRWQKQGAKR